MRTGILEPDGFSNKALEALEKLGPVTLFNNNHLPSFINNIDILFIRLGFNINENFLENAPKLRFLVSPTTGHTHIDIKALDARKIRLVSLAGERSFLRNIKATPEHTLGLILAVLRNYRKAFISENNPNWDRDLCRGDEIAGAKVGLIGYGRVGQILGRYLTAMEAEIYWFDPTPTTEHSEGIACENLMSLIDKVDIVVMCASHTPGSPPILDSTHLALLKGKYFVNTSRGELVDETFLIKMLEAKELAGAALDVIAGEQTTADRRRWEAIASANPEVIITPHIAGATWRSMKLTEEFAAEKLINLINQQTESYSQ